MEYKAVVERKYSKNGIAVHANDNDCYWSILILTLRGICYDPYHTFILRAICYGS